MKETNDMSTEKQIVTAGNSAVVINRQGCCVWANVYVNARNGLNDADITLLRWTGSTMAGARRWATKQLAGA